jgi:hypothetical protein
MTRSLLLNFISRSYMYRKGYVLNPPKSDQESVLMMRCPIRIRTKFWQHNSAVLRLHDRNGAAENIGIMPLKFRPDLNQASQHKYALSGTPRLFKNGQFQIYMPHMCNACKMCKFETGNTLSSTTYNLTIEIN